MSCKFLSPFSKKVASKGRARGPKCEFEEEYDKDLSQSRFRSALNPEWYLGFSREGRPLQGSAFKEQRCQNCFQFYKTESTAKDKHPEHLLVKNINVTLHNKIIGQLPPGLSEDFFDTKFQLTIPSEDILLQNIFATTTTTTTTTAAPAPPHLRHKGRHQSRKFEAGLRPGRARHSKKSQRRKGNRPLTISNSNKSRPASFPPALPPPPNFVSYDR